MSRSEDFPGVLVCDPYDVTPEDFERLVVGGKEGLNAIWTQGAVPKGELEHTIDWAMAQKLAEGGTKDYTNDVRGDGGELLGAESYGVNLSALSDPYSFSFGTPPGSPERQKYQSKVGPAMEFCEAQSAPYRWLGHTILEGWAKLHPAGAKRPRLEQDEEALCGLLRYTLSLQENPASEKLGSDPHIDVLPPEVIRELLELGAAGANPTLIELLRPYVRMVSENYYFTVPRLGGEIFTSPTGRTGPRVMIKPGPGDSIKIRTTDFHGVVPSPTEDRLTGQLFGAVLLTPDGKAIDRSTPMVGWN